SSDLPPRDRPRALSTGAGGARRFPALPGAAVAAQEPRAALRGDEAAARAPPRAYRLRGAGAGRRGVAGPGLARRARVALPPGGRARLPVAARGLRPAAARGDGV